MERLTVLAISLFFIARRVNLSSTTGITQPFIISLSYLYSTCGGKIRAALLDVVEINNVNHTFSKEEAPTHIALLQGVLGSIEEVWSVCCPDPLVFRGFIFLLVVKLKLKRYVELISNQ